MVGKRRNYLIAKVFQLKYVGWILLFMFVTAALCSYAVYSAGVADLGKKLANVYPQGRFVSIMKTVNLRILFGLLLMTPIVVVIGVLLSHKIAGPLFRIERYVNNMTYGDFSSYIILRKGDELASLADRINQLIKTAKSNIGDHKGVLNKVSRELDSLKSPVCSGPECRDMLMAGINRVDHEVKRLVKELNKYKL